MTCEEVKPNLTLYLLNDLDAAAHAKIEKHLKQCKGCRAEALEAHSTLDLLRDALAAPSSAPAKLSGSRHQHIFHAGDSVERRIDWWIVRSHKKLSFAAAALFVVCFVWLATLGTRIVTKDTAKSVRGIELEEAKESYPLAQTTGEAVPFTSVRRYKRNMAQRDAGAGSEDMDGDGVASTWHRDANTPQWSAGKQASKPSSKIDVSIVEPQPMEELEDVEEIIDEAPEPPAPVETRYGLIAGLAPEPPPEAAPAPPPDFSPTPAQFDSVAIVKSPVIMKNIYGNRFEGGRTSGRTQNVPDRHRTKSKPAGKNWDRLAEGDEAMKALDALSPAPRPAAPMDGPAPAPEEPDVSFDDLGSTYRDMGLALSAPAHARPDPASSPDDDAVMVPLEIELPKPIFKGTPKPVTPARPTAPKPPPAVDAKDMVTDYLDVSSVSGNKLAVATPKPGTVRSGVSADQRYLAAPDAPKKPASGESRRENALVSRGSATAASVPLLGDLPATGRLFKERAAEGEREEKYARGPEKKQSPARKRSNESLSRRRSYEGVSATATRQDAAAGPGAGGGGFIYEAEVADATFTAGTKLNLSVTHDAKLDASVLEKSTWESKPVGGSHGYFFAVPDLAPGDDNGKGKKKQKAAGEVNGWALMSDRDKDANMKAEEALNRDTQLRYTVDGTGLHAERLIQEGREAVANKQLIEATEIELGDDYAGEYTAATDEDRKKATKGVMDIFAAEDHDTVDADEKKSGDLSKPHAGVTVSQYVVSDKLQKARKAKIEKEALRAQAAAEAEEERNKREEELAGPRFKAFGVNPFVMTYENAFSTFSIDVDTASYTLARNYINKGALPMAESVRTEEFVNFFDYAYRPPRKDTFAVHVECAPSAFGRGLHQLKIGVKGRRLGREEQRPAVLTFLVDASGSMDQPDRVGLVKKSLTLLAKKLGPNDQVAIVQYGSRARVVLEHTSAAQLKKILKAIDGMQCGGSTNLEAGMRKAYGLAAQNFLAGGENRVLLLSDGVANLGEMAAADILSSVERYRKQGIYCSCFGFGMGTYDDATLETLANKGDGSYTFIDSEKEARRVFVDDLSATLNTIASDVKIQVEFNKDWIKRYRQLGYENRQLKKEQFRDDTVDAGEVGSGQSVTALYELEFGEGPKDIFDDEPEPLATVRVRYRRVDNGQVEEVAVPVRTADTRTTFDEASSRFKLAACVAEFAEVLRNSPHARGGSYDDIRSKLTPVAHELYLDKRVQELLGMVNAARGLPRAAQ